MKNLKKLSWFFVSHLGRIGLGAILCLLGGIIYSITGKFEHVISVGVGLIALEGLIMITYAWIINPLRDYKAKQNKK